MDALDELKSTDKLISASLQNELEGLRKQHKTLQLDYDQQKTQLIDALLSKDRLRKEVDESSKETALASPTVANAAGSVLDQAAVDELVRKSNEKLAKLGARVKQQKEVSQEQSPRLRIASGGRSFPAPHFLCGARRAGLLPELHECFVFTHPGRAALTGRMGTANREGRPRKIRPATAPQSCRTRRCFRGTKGRQARGGGLHIPRINLSSPLSHIQLRLVSLSRDDADSRGILSIQAANDQIIKSLQRENAMIATAWYDLTSRLQSNHVVLQRRQDMPKSWLNKQRQMVNGKLLADLP